MNLGNSSWSVTIRHRGLAPQQTPIIWQIFKKRNVSGVSIERKSMGAIFSDQAFLYYIRVIYWSSEKTCVKCIHFFEIRTRSMVVEACPSIYRIYLGEDLKSYMKTILRYFCTSNVNHDTKH